MQYDYLIVGAGFAGSVAAERLAAKGEKVLIVEKRPHIGGNAYDEYDENGVLIHRYGPHIFHTNSKEVFEYLSQFTEWRKYEHKVLAKLNGTLYPIPINRITINKLYGENFKTEQEIAAFYERIRAKKSRIKNSEDLIVNQIGWDLYEKFFKHYTRKQWGLDASELQPSVLERIPVRTNDDDRYFTDKYQYMPKEGFTKMFERMLSNKNIEIRLNMDYKKILNGIKFDKMIYTGPIDYFFDYEFGKLPYRSIMFEWKNYKKEKFQETAVINYVEKKLEFTRITEYKYLTGQQGATTTISKEFPQAQGEPYYPIPTEENIKRYLLYKEKANTLKNVIFLGRLAEYKYYNMDTIIKNILVTFI